MSLAPSQIYEKLAGNGDCPDNENVLSARAQSLDGSIRGRERRGLVVLLRIIWCPLAIAGLVLLLIGIITLVVGPWSMVDRSPTTRNSDNIREKHTCGNSSVEALALGCEFDQLTWAWYPAGCPHYANDEFVNAEPERPWKYYDSLHHGNALYSTDENWFDVLDSGIQLWGERREHLTHCVFLFLSVGQILRDGTPYTSKLGDYEHLDHCRYILLDALRLDEHWMYIETAVPGASFVETC